MNVSPTSSYKAKARANDTEVERFAREASLLDQEDGHDTTSTDYQTALESVLYNPHDMSTNLSNGAVLRDDARTAEDNERFVYDGEDDEDTKAFREEARLESLSYQDRLDSVLQDGLGASRAEPAAEVESTSFQHPIAGPSTSTPPRSPPSSSWPRSSPKRQGPESPPGWDLSNGPLSHHALPPSQPFPRPRRKASLGSNASSTTPSSPTPSSPVPDNSFRSQSYSHLAARRPAMNPLVSRLRSTSATPSQSFRGVRSVSQTSSLASLMIRESEDAQHGFANDSISHRQEGNATQTGFDGPHSPSLAGSRRSSSSNIAGIAARNQRANMNSPHLGSDLLEVDGAPSETSAGRSNTAYARPATAHAIHEQVSPIRWTSLKRLSSRIFSEAAAYRGSTSSQQKPDSATCFAVSGGLIVTGSRAGWATVFDYAQNTKAVLGNEDIAAANGSVTAVALSQDTSFVAVAYDSGCINLFEWERKPGTPARNVIPTNLQAINAGKAEGHIGGGTKNGGSHVRYLGFVVSRHTAIVSGDHYGLCFYHSLGKVLGLANTDILRILGKYPNVTDTLLPRQNGSHSTSAPVLAVPNGTLLGVQPLPIGTLDHATDTFSLVALLTPGKLVVAGLKPTPRTWWRCLNEDAPVTRSKPKHQADDRPDSTEMQTNSAADHNGQLGSLAWLPSIDGQDPMLAFCWDKELRIVQVGVRSSGAPAKQNGSDHRASSQRTFDASLTFRSLQIIAHKRGQADHDSTRPVYQSADCIISIQWLSKGVIALLTVRGLALFSLEGMCLLETAIFADSGALSAFRDFNSQSLRSYKRKLFLLGTRDLQVGTVLSWADRVLQLVSLGDLVGAIDLLVLYYTYEDLETSTQESLNRRRLPLESLELPSDKEARQSAVEPKLHEILMASADYVFSEDRMRDSTHVDPSGRNRGVDRTDLFRTLVDATIRASLACQHFGFLFEDLAERFSANGIEGIFLEQLEPFILKGSIKFIPVDIVQRLLKRHEERGDLEQIEHLIWHIDPTCLDVHQAVSLCSRHRLYNALIYVYTNALGDFVGPLVVLLGLVRAVTDSRSRRPRWTSPFDENDSIEDTTVEDESMVPGAYVVYSYLADSLVGLSHPNQEPLESHTATAAKRSLYTFLFAASLQEYPDGSGAMISVNNADQNARMPYLRLLLRFDTEALLDCLDMAFEDSYLDEDAETEGTLNRQEIVDILLKLSQTQVDSDSQDLMADSRTLINIFVARNLPKYSQFLHLDETAARELLYQLADDPDLSTREDRELAVEYLLSAYHPPFDAALLQTFERAEFYRVLASHYHMTKAWSTLASVLLRDLSHGDSLIRRLESVVCESSSDAPQHQATLEVIIHNIPTLVTVDVSQTSHLVERHMPEKHNDVLLALQENPLRQMAYLRSLLEPGTTQDSDAQNGPPVLLADDQRYTYVSLLSKYDPVNARAYLRASADLSPERLLSICRRNDDLETVIWLHARDGDIRRGLEVAQEAMQDQSQEIMSQLMQYESAHQLQEAPIQRITSVTRMCVSVAASAASSASDAVAIQIWTAILSSLTGLTKDLGKALPAPGGRDFEYCKSRVILPLRGLVAEALASLVSARADLSQSTLLRALMQDDSNASYAQYKDILNSMLQTHHFEEDLLHASLRLVREDLHLQVANLSKAREQGWHPDRSGLCEACGRPVWLRLSEKSRLEDPSLVLPSASGLEVKEKLKVRPNIRRRPSLKGKETDWYEDEPRKAHETGSNDKSLVVFRGGAICHAACLQQGR